MMKVRFVILIVALAVITSVVIAQSRSATVNGTVVFVSKAGEFVGIAPSTTIQVAVDDLRGEFTTDAMGDFSKRLPVCKYTITGVVGCGRQKFALYEKQQRTFELSSDQFKRFDVMVMAPEQQYKCTAQQK
jgi:hypothetical protein